MRSEQAERCVENVFGSAEGDIRHLFVLIDGGMDGDWIVSGYPFPFSWCSLELLHVANENAGVN